jgi:hypothetical protein
MIFDIMIHYIHPSRQLCYFYISLPLIFYRNQSFVYNCYFVRTIFVFPVESFVIAQLLDADERDKLLYVVVFEVVGVEHAHLYKFMDLVYLADLMRLAETVIRVGGECCIYSIFPKVEIVLRWLRELYVFRQVEGHIVVAKAPLNNK